MSEDEQIFFDDYLDRGTKKWAGFYLSEHTALLDQRQANAKPKAPPKRQLSQKEINERLHLALTKNKVVAIQIEAVNLAGHYGDDIIGLIQGHDTRGVFIAGQKIDYDEIRHVSIYAVKKWSQLD